MLQAFPCATQQHVMATMSALGPAGAWEIANTRFWLVGSKAIILIGFPLLYMFSYFQSSAVDAN